MPSHLTQRGRKSLWTKNDSQGNCWLCNGWVHIGRKLRCYSGSYGLCLGHAKLASPVWSYSLNPMCDFSLLEKGKSLVKAKPASERDGEELHLCHLCSNLGPSGAHPAHLGSKCKKRGRWQIVCQLQHLRAERPASQCEGLLLLPWLQPPLPPCFGSSGPYVHLPDTRSAAGETGCGSHR